MSPVLTPRPDDSSYTNNFRMFTAHRKCATYRLFSVCKSTSEGPKKMSQENLRESADNATYTTQNYSEHVDRDTRYEISRVNLTLDSVLAHFACLEVQPKSAEQPRVSPLSYENQGATGGYQLPDQANQGARRKLTQVE